jgi:hypothetical protein
VHNLLSFFLSFHSLITQCNNMIMYEVHLSLSEKKRQQVLESFSCIFFSDNIKVYVKCSLSLLGLKKYMYGTNFTHKKQQILSSADPSTNKQYNMFTLCSSCELFTSSNQHPSGSTIVWIGKKKNSFSHTTRFLSFLLFVTRAAHSSFSTGGGLLLGY